jgi:hypothetical protein
MFDQVGELESGSGTSSYQQAILNACYQNPRKLTFKVCHEGLGSRTQSVDDHLSIRGSSNFYPPIFQTRSWWSTPPSNILPDLLGRVQEVQVFAGVELGLNFVSVGEKLFTGSVECSMKDRQEFECFGSKDFGSSFRRR